MDVNATIGTRHVYETPLPAYALAMSSCSEARFRFALGSCTEHEANCIQVVELNEETNALELKAEIEHALPATKLIFRPQSSETGQSDVFASASTTLNLYKVEGNPATEVKLHARFANSRLQEAGHLPPLTSFDWHTVNQNKLGTSSVDTTCTIWNLERQKVESQLIAHDKAVYDIAFSHVDSLFASVSADGSLRLFDQRNLAHSTIIYETCPPCPLLRLAWNKNNTNQIATVAMDTIGVILMDIRRPNLSLAQLPYHNSCLNCIAWAPHSRNHLLCGSDNGFALIWNVKELPIKTDKVQDNQIPLLAYGCDHEIYQCQWPTAQPDHIGLGMARGVEILQI